MGQTFGITLLGQVQGVGFRPFVFQLAHQMDLRGQVCNNGEGVFITLNGTKKQALLLLRAIEQKAPKAAQITGHRLEELTHIPFTDFTIQTSHNARKPKTPLTPDFVICDNCKNEIRDTGNRRYRYAFTTCTSCGPRYAITRSYPFERENTSLSGFSMCPACQAEYTAPEDIRFHSQTNSCTSCGVKLWVTDNAGNLLTEHPWKSIGKIARYLDQGAIVAIKNNSGYLLCCHAQRQNAIKTLRKRKHRPSKPFAVLYPSIEKIENDFELSEKESEALYSPVGPIVLIRPKNLEKFPNNAEIAPHLDRIGVMLPSSGLLTLIMDAVQSPIIATSGNAHGQPIIGSVETAQNELAPMADYFLHHNMPISFPQDDSVLRIVGPREVKVRRSRGLAPNYIGHRHIGLPTLAMGAHLKSSFCFAPGENTYISPYFGSLDHYGVYERFKTTITEYFRVFKTTPSHILVDTHPSYQSTILGNELAKDLGLKTVKVPHHKAHFASVLGEHGQWESKTPIMGVIWDGTGYGEDDMLWGGEFFEYYKQQIARIGHFEYVNWLGGDNMPKQPRLSLLTFLSQEQHGGVREKFSDMEWKLYAKLLEKSTLKTSSVGRLFDAVACLLLDIDHSSYEGETGMRLETLANSYKGGAPKDLLDGDYTFPLASKDILARLCGFLARGADKSFLAYSFIHTLATGILGVARGRGRETIACSGGVFQNGLLVALLSEYAKTLKIKLIFNRILSSNDENIAFGQLCYHQFIKS